MSLAMLKLSSVHMPIFPVMLMVPASSMELVVLDLSDI
jgi:hypothetical protein